MTNSRAPQIATAQTGSENPEASGSSRVFSASNLRLLGVSIILLVLCSLSISPLVPFPYWESDPLIEPPFVVGLAPSTTQLLHLLALVGSVITLLSLPRAGQRWSTLFALACVLLGAVPLLIHTDSFWQLDNYRIGSSWFIAVLSSLSIFLASRSDHRVKVLALATILGLLSMLLAKGLIQVFIDHPALVENFKANRERIFASNGWTADSSMARSYERRILQAESSAWYGLANVFASIACATFAISLTLLFSWFKARKDARELCETPPSTLAGPILFCFTTISLFCIALAGSKAGLALGLLALVLCAVALLAHNITQHIRANDLSNQPSSNPSLLIRLFCSRLTLALGPALIIAALLTVLARGMIGEKLAELSMLFRWFYIETAAKIFANNPVTGVGPAAFKDFYAINKPLISPEDVISPHSIFFDYLATLGSFGLFWSALIIIASIRASRNLFATKLSDFTNAASSPGPSPRTLIRWVVAISASASILAISQNAAALLGSELPLRLISIISWPLISGSLIIFFMRPFVLPWISRACAAAGLILITHAQIELTLSNPASALLCMTLIALGAAGPTLRAGDELEAINKPEETPPDPTEEHLYSSPSRNPVLTLATFVTCILLFICAWRLINYPAVAAWESSLKQAAEVLPRPDPKTNQITVSPQTVTSLVQTSADQMAVASAQVRHWSTAREASRMQALVGIRLASSDSATAKAYFTRAIHTALAGSSAPITSPQAGWIGNIYLQQARVFQDPAALQSALASFQTAAALDPSNTLHPIKLMDLYATNGDQANARIWAKESLLRNTYQRLDPLTRGMTEAELSRATRLANP